MKQLLRISGIVAIILLIGVSGSKAHASTVEGCAKAKDTISYLTKGINSAWWHKNQEEKKIERLYELHSRHVENGTLTQEVVNDLNRQFNRASHNMKPHQATINDLADQRTSLRKKYNKACK